MKKPLLYIYFPCILSSFIIGTNTDNNVSHISLYNKINITEENSGSDLVSEYRFIIPHTSDTILFNNPRICDINDSVMWIYSNRSLFGMNINDGKVIYHINRHGRSDDRYCSVGEVFHSSENNNVYLFDYVRSNLHIYTPEGNQINRIKMDDVHSVNMCVNGNLAVSYDVAKKPAHLIGVYNGDFTLNNEMKENKLCETDIPGIKKSRVMKFNNQNYIYLSDTLFRFSGDTIRPAIILDKGKYKMPFSFEGLADKKDERSKYIINESGLLCGDYYFLSFNYNREIYYDLWDIEKGKLLQRRTIGDYREPEGIAFTINDTKVYLWPKYVNDGKIYSVLNRVNQESLFPEKPLESNPVIVEIELK